MIEANDALLAVHGQVAVEELVFGEDVHNEHLPTGSAQPHGTVDTTHGRDHGCTHLERLQPITTQGKIHGERSNK